MLDLQIKPNEPTGRVHDTSPGLAWGSVGLGRDDLNPREITEQLKGHHPRSWFDGFDKGFLNFMAVPGRNWWSGFDRGVKKGAERDG